MVIVILGAIAAVALPKFVDLSEQATAAKLVAARAAISAGGYVNNAAVMAGSPKAVVFSGGPTAGGVQAYGCNHESIAKIAEGDWENFEISDWGDGLQGCTMSGGPNPVWPSQGFCGLNTKGGDPNKAIKVTLLCGKRPS